MAYKKDQGRIARMAVFWSLAVLAFYGCASLRRELAGRVPALAQKLMAKIPVIGVEVTGALLISLVVFAGVLVLVWRWQEKPKNAELLIETESELRKVTWPTGQEVMNASTVVVLFVVFLMAFLAGADWLLGRVTSVVLFGRG
jgi:preprotein translocase SecE subunit